LRRHRRGQRPDASQQFPPRPFERLVHDAAVGAVVGELPRSAVAPCYEAVVDALDALQHEQALAVEDRELAESRDE
jgi:hypothetical protein